MLHCTRCIELNGPFVTTSTTVGRQCKHLNGWYAVIPFWIFSRKVFVCSDCGDALYGKRLKEWHTKKNEFNGGIMEETLSKPDAVSSSAESALLACGQCGREPKLMRTPFFFSGYFYECCGVMGSFPGAESEAEARKDWNESQAR